MKPLRRHASALGCLTAALLLTTVTGVVAAGAGPPRPGWPEPESVPDSRRLEPEELERLAAGATLTTQVSTELMVEGRPVLTDRRSLRIPAAHFTPTDTQIGGPFDDSFRFEDGFVFETLDNCGGAVAPVYLPEGVTVASVVVSGIDNGTGWITIRLRRRFAFTTDNDVMSVIRTVGDNPGVAGWVDNTVDHAVIQNGLYSYDLEASCLSPNHKLREVFMYYDYP